VEKGSCLTLKNIEVPRLKQERRKEGTCATPSFFCIIEEMACGGYFGEFELLVLLARPRGGIA
jgi:hypothetical protein